MIGDSPHSDLNQPAARILRESLFRPLQRRSEQRLLHAIFRCAEVAEATDHRAENLRCQFTQQVLVGELRRVVASHFDRRCAHHFAHLDRHVQRRAAFAWRG